jgi:putative lipoprotein
MSQRALLGVALASAAALVLGSARAEQDAWFGRDKALHFGVSVALGASGYAASSLVLDERWQRAAAGGALSVSIGAGKELYDATSSGDASWKDFAWDVAGTAVGVGIAWLIDLALAGSDERALDARRARWERAPAWDCSTAKFAW